jgi:hypothetical protein
MGKYRYKGKGVEKGKYAAIHVKVLFTDVKYVAISKLAAIKKAVRRVEQN